MQPLCHKKIPELNIMNCPLCSMPQEGFLKGIIKDGDNLVVVEDKFYAFCNCHNILFTDWKNMQQEVYNEYYQEKYNLPSSAKKISPFDKRMFENIPVKDGIFVEVGVVNDIILDHSKEVGFTEQIAMDINEHTKTKHNLLVGSLDDINIPKFDVMWLSHVMEHVKDPIAVMKKILKSAHKNGCVYVAMPDPWFIPLDNPNSWAHLHCREHHIMWDMDSFIDMCISLGYKHCHSERRSFGADYHIILTKGKK